MSARPYWIGFLGGAALMTVPIWFAIESGAAQAGGGGSAAAPVEGGTEADRLRQEVELLRRQLRSSTSGTEEERVRAAARLARASDPGSEDAAARRRGDARMPELLRALADLQKSDALAKCYQDPDTLLAFLLETWLEAGEPTRALALLERFELNEGSSAYCVQAACHLVEQGDRANAVRACLMLARSGFQVDHVVDLAMDLEPGRILEELRATTIRKGEAWEGWRAQEGALLLASGDQKAAYLIVDALLAEGDLPDWIWPHLVERTPAAAEARLRTAIAAMGRQQTQANKARWGNLGKRGGSQLPASVVMESEEEDPRSLSQQLALALHRQGKSAAALEVARGLVESGLDEESIETFRQVDPQALREYLGKRARADADANTWHLYGESLAAEKDMRRAMAAWWAAVELEPSSASAHRLVAHLSAAELPRLEIGARAEQNDELIGDIADRFWELGSRERAVILWTDASTFDPEDSEWSEKIRKARAGKDPLQ